MSHSMISEWWLILLLPGAAATGWWSATRGFSRKRSAKKRDPFSNNYIEGLNFLLNEEPDKALDVFIRLLDIDSDTVETHLILGTLFRRRGEVNRAIRIHQNLIARPNLETRYRTEALAALAQDYLSAGVLDRAEHLFLELMELGDQQRLCLRYLLQIYEQEKSWRKALDIVSRLLKFADDETRQRASHYYCELAEQALAKHQLEEARQLLKSAFSTDKRSVRVSLLFAELEAKEGRYRKAIRYLKHIKNQEPAFLSEAIQPYMAYCRALGREEEAIRYFQGLLKEYPKMPIVSMISDQIRQARGDQAAVEFVSDYVRKNPSVAGLHRLVELHISLVDDTSKDDLMLLHGLTKRLLTEQASYRCQHCGFSSKQLHWHCPCCRKWSTMRPTYTFEES